MLAPVTLVLTELFLLGLHNVYCVNLKLGLMGMFNSWNGPPVNLRRSGSAVDMALEDIHNNGTILPGYNLSYIIGKSECDSKLALSAFVDLVRDNEVWAAIGPVCSSPSLAAGLLASTWNTPLIAYGGTGDSLSNKLVYDTFSRLVVPNGIRVHMICDIVTQFGWRKIGLFHTDPPIHHQWYLDALPTYLKDQEIVKQGFDNLLEPVNIRSSLKNLSQDARIIVVLAYMSQVSSVMLAAYDEGFFNTNEYVFITLDTRHNEEVVDMPWMWTGDPEKDRKLHIAYQSVLHVITVPYFLNQEYKDFLEEVRVRLRDPPWNSNLSSIEEVSDAAANLYDAVMLYALTADSMLKQGMDPRDGRLFTKHARTILFKGKTGDVSVNENNDRNENYIITDYQNGSFVRVAYFDGFTREYRSEKQVYWTGGSSEAPLDMPECGYIGELCIVDVKKDLTGTVTGSVLGLLAIFMLLGGGLFYRKKQFEAELMSESWKISFADLRFGKDMKSSIHSMMSDRSFTQGSEGNNVAIFRAEKLYVKFTKKPTIDWKKRSILLELKRMRDIRHDNLLTFVGACVEPSHICVLTSYCPRGNLQDVLENDDIQLDITFKISFAIDVISGLQCIHKSDLQWHGSLKSTNCLVDTRWTVKLTGYGLQEFCNAGTKLDDIGEYAFNRKLLWTAPELLRIGFQTSGSQKGDIYSFAILLHEIMMRSGPWGNTELTPAEIVEKVKNTTSKASFRPDVSAENCPVLITQLMEKCWTEAPANRPDLIGIRNSLKMANGNRNINIMDNMVSMLEKYASNLEDIVADRTRQLMDEKKKTDTLLYQMLPEQVAEKLKHGKMVEAENYDLVTIFFSDIVGFTSLSAKSTPMQVVDLLNDLYTTFDSTLELFDVYKVETIGDAYMVVSGLPVCNGIQHAGEIATMSLELLSVVSTFRIRHFPDHKLLLRIGIHSGPCVAGVVGLKMPRYCLFGDTVNTASRMESNGQAHKIHVSGACKNILDTLGGYTISERGMIEMKGKGVQMTFWLEGKTGFDKPLPKTTSSLKMLQM